MNFLLPQGIGDCLWALTKIKAVADKLGSGVIDCYVQYLHACPAEFRAHEFLRRFDFVRSVAGYQTGIVKSQECDERGIPRYIESGPTCLPGIDFVLVPNRQIDTGKRLEKWLPEYETDWHVCDHFRFTHKELWFADQMKRASDYVVFFMGTLAGNTGDGHNREGMWKPSDWAALGEEIEKMGLNVVVVGSMDDWDYWSQQVKPIAKFGWTELVGGSNIGETLALCRGAKFVISYQSGIGMFPVYVGTPSAVFYRPWGNSLSYATYRSQENAAATSWVPPHMLEIGKYLPLFYGQHDVRYIVDQIKERKWV